MHMGATHRVMESHTCRYSALREASKVSPIFANRTFFENFQHSCSIASLKDSNTGGDRRKRDLRRKAARGRIERLNNRVKWIRPS